MNIKVKFGLIILLILGFVLICGCVIYETQGGYYSEPQPVSNYQTYSTPEYSSNSYQSTNNYKQSSSCPPSLSNCQVTRGGAGQVLIQCYDGRQYTKGSAGQIIIQYPGKQISVGSAGQENIQGFEYDEAVCLIDWLRTF